MLLWDAKAARTTLTVAMVVALLYGVYTIRRTLFVFFLAILFAYMVQPLVRALDRIRPRRAPPWASSLAALILVLSLMVLLGTLAGPPIADEAGRLADQLPALSRRVDSVETWAWPVFLQPYAQRIAVFLRTELQGGAAQALPLARRIGSSVLQLASDALLVVLVPILAFLFILSATRIRTEITRLFAGQVAGQRIVEDLNRLFGRYIRALLLLSLAAFTAYALFLSSVGAPYALLLAAAAALLEFVPVFGPLLSALIIIAVAGLAGYPHLLWILFFIVGYRVFQDYFLAPRLMGAEAGLHPILILFGLLAGEEIAGVAGIFLSVPVMAAAMILARHLISYRAMTRRQN
jgi:predicted PurR-regulated permease PerM